MSDKNQNDHGKVLLNVERNTSGEITDWEATLRISDVIKILQEMIDQKTQSGDLDGAEVAKNFLQAIVNDVEIEIEQEQNKGLLPETRTRPP